MRTRQGILLVAVGMVAGAMTTYYALWRTHALVPGHPLTLRTSEIVSPRVRLPRTIPPTVTPTPTPTPAPAPAK